MPIRILADQVASQIAAGEVVERPASVIKELIENAIDAGARTINVDVRAGGRELIQVADDGIGISEEEIEVAFRRHATSKLTTAADLEAIETLGFRGEALAAISAVSQVTAVSRTNEASAGVRLMLEGGRLASRETVGAPRGTVIAAANLFYNVPARLKFLKTITTEKRLIDEYVTRYALAYPEIRFRLTHDNRITFQSSGQNNFLDVLAAIYGPETARELIQVTGIEQNGSEGERHDLPDAAHEVAVTGFISPPELNWANRKQITLYVNRRWIKDHRLTYAVIQAYHTLLTVGRFPLAVLFLEMPAQSVDVNVHPAKIEVRFRQENQVFSAVQRAVREALIGGSSIPQLRHFPQGQPAAWGGSLDRSAFTRHDQSLGQEQLGLDWRAHTPGDQASVGDPVDLDARQLGGERLPIMRVVGQAGNAYIITEGPDGLYLIDQHAAHERILYEQFMATWQENGHEQGMAAQGLVSGVPVQLTPDQATLLEDQLELLDQIGFQVEGFGPNAFMVRSIPALLQKLDPAKALQDVVEDLERGEAPLESRIEARLILRVCKSAAVKAGQTMNMAEMEALVRQLEACASPRTCPHGRPTLIHLSVAQLAREFSRT